MIKLFKSVLLFLLIISSIKAQFLRNVLFEEATNASCGPCAANNPYLKAYIDSKGDTIKAIKYHASFPGFDPMYQHNPTQNAERYAAYYGMNAMPWLNVDGIINDVWPFTLTNFNNAYYGRLAIPAPLKITVIDQKIAGDSIKSTITVNVPSNLPSGNYYLRVMAIERWIIYQSPPGSNGETSFEHVFRRAYPSTLGTPFNGTAGTHNFVFTYKINDVWKDTSVMTVVFIQNDVNKEVLNCAEGKWNGIIGINNNNNSSPKSFNLKQNYPNPFNPVTYIDFDLPVKSHIRLSVFDLLGREVYLLANGFFDAGTHSIDFNAVNLPSGIYFYKLTAEKFSQTKKMILLK